MAVFNDLVSFMYGNCSKSHFLGSVRRKISYNIFAHSNVWIVAGERLLGTGGNVTKKGPHVTPPFLWSSEYRAKNHSLEWILRRGLTSISGEVQCKRCDGMTTVEVNLQVRFLYFSSVFQVDIRLYPVYCWLMLLLLLLSSG